MCGLCGELTFDGSAADAGAVARMAARQAPRGPDGEGIVANLAAGRTDVLARDVEDEAERRWIARAVVSAAKSHVALGLTLRQTTVAERDLAGQSERKGATDWDL